MTYNELSSRIIGAAIDVHRELGPGLIESVYERCLVHLLRETGLHVETQVPVPIVFRGIELGKPLRLDVIVEHRIIVEVKAIESIPDVHSARLLSYLRLTNKKLGLMVNFHQSRLVDGVRRVVNGLDED